jgi:ABC-type polysaccharide/polyol phosphate transport system ATPase subunit
VSGSLHVQGVGKAYFEWGSDLRRIASWLGVPIRPRAEHWILRGIDFRVAPGETVGLIGRNGAGKSTLLKIITGTTRPTTGAVHLDGRTSAILELGMGFNPELTGRQNAVHAAGLMGFRSDRIRAVMDEIEAFAEVGEYFDQPMRTYSSGMQVRVAFSVATAFKPDLLIVDEALSVGDSYFQHKSFDRMRRFREEGVSIILVSHSMADVKSLCDRVLLLDGGRIVRDGRPDEVVDFYNALIAQQEAARMSIEQRREKHGWLLTRSGDGRARVVDMAIVDDDGRDVAVARVGQMLTIRIRVHAFDDLPSLVLGLMIRDRQGNVIWGSNTWHTGQVLTDVVAGGSLDFAVRFECTLGPGSYSVSPALVSTDTHLVDNFEWTDNLLVFDVVNVDYPVFIGNTRLDARFDIRRSPNGALPGTEETA